jgi:hypothetical protein
MVVASDAFRFLLLLLLLCILLHCWLQCAALRWQEDDDDDHAGQCTSAALACTSSCGGGGCGGAGDTHEWCSVWPVDQKDDAALDTSTETTDFSSTMTRTKGDALARATTQFGVWQVAEGDRALETLDLIAKSVLYMASHHTSSRPSSSSSADHHLVHSIINDDQSCHNRHELCAFWAVVGECDDNPVYMHTHCGPSCQSCHHRTTDIRNDDNIQEDDEDERCRRLVNDQKEPVLSRPGDVNRLFERIVRQAPGNRTWSGSSEPQRRRRQWHDEEEQQQQQQSPMMMPLYTVHVHSRPDPQQQLSHLSSSASLSSSSSPPPPQLPWVVTLDNFLTDDECHDLIALGYEYGYRPSSHVGGSDETTTMRTSETAWCSDQMGCRWRDLPQRLHERITTVLDLPSANYSEDLQLLKYEAGQYYRTHHDYIPQQGKCGPSSTQTKTSILISFVFFACVDITFSEHALWSTHIDLLVVLERRGNGRWHELSPIEQSDHCTETGPRRVVVQRSRRQSIDTGPPYGPPGTPGNRCQYQICR